MNLDDQAIKAGMSDHLLYEVLDRLDRIEHMLKRDQSNVTPLWLDKRQLAKAIGKSPRWIEDRMPEGMPHRILGSRPQFNLAKVEAWMVKQGLLREVA